MAYSSRGVDSLLSVTVDYVVKHLTYYIANELETLQSLPPKIKTRMLHKFTSTSYFWSNLNFKNAVSALVHPKTENIDFSLANVDDEILSILKDCHNLKDVYLTRTSNRHLTTQALVDFLTPLKNLHSLEIANCEGVNNDVLKAISTSCPALAGLDVTGCKNVSDAGLKEISKMKNLQWLTFSSTRVTNEGIKTLATGASGSNIKELRVANCKYINGDILKVITEFCHNIEVLVFYNIESVDHETQTCFPLHEGSLKNLKQLTWTIQW